MIYHTVLSEVVLPVLVPWGRVGDAPTLMWTVGWGGRLGFTLDGCQTSMNSGGAESPFDPS